MGAFHSAGVAQEQLKKEPDPYSFSIRVYRLPAPELEIGFVSKERGKLRAPALPPPNASNGEIEIFIKRSHDVVKEYFGQQGVTLPKGSLACYDPASATLALRAMSVVHDLVAPFAEAMLNQSPKHVAWSLEVVEAPDVAVRAAIKGATGLADHSGAFEKLLPLGKSVVTMRGETKSGQATTVRQGALVDDPDDYTADDKPHVEATFHEKRVGTEFSMIPTVGADNHTLDLTVSLSHQHGAGVPRWDSLTDGSAGKIEARWVDYPSASVKTSITATDRATRMLGVWALDGVSDAARGGNLRAAFLRAAIVNLLPLEDLRVEQLIKSRGEAVDPLPKAVRPVGDPNLPPGMIVRRFRVAPDFLSLGGKAGAAAAAAPADPFAGGGAANEPMFLRRMNVDEVLRAQGIPFPEGASANFISKTSELVVRNTPANIVLVAEFLESIADTKTKYVGFSLHIVQADAALIRRLERETFLLPDHSAAWKTIEDAVTEGTAKIARSAWLETNSGQQAITESVIEYARSDGANYGSNSETTEAGKPDKEKDAAAPVAKATIVNNGGNAWLATSSEMRPVGLRMEVEPTVGADGKAVDLNVSVGYDYAPPVQRLMDEPVPDKTTRLAVPTTEFRTSVTKTSTTMLSGTTRMLSVWKPGGTPELEGDVLQAIFLRADVVMVEPAVKP